jgi:hypothetical protein
MLRDRVERGADSDSCAPGRLGGGVGRNERSTPPRMAAVPGGYCSGWKASTREGADYRLTSIRGDVAWDDWNDSGVGMA